MRAILYYDFSVDQWVAVLDHNSIEGWGSTPQEAVDSLRYVCNKHGLWPKETK